MRRRPDLAIIAGSLAVAATLILVPVSLWLTVTGPADPGSSIVDRVLYRLFGLTLGPVGLLIATRRRTHRIAWILIALGLDVSVSAVASDAAKAAAGPRAVTALGMVSDLGWLVLLMLMAALVLLYPDGQLPSRRWWPLGVALPGWLVLFFGSVMLAPTSLHNGVPVPNPFGWASGALGELAQLSLGVAVPLLVPLMLAVVAAAIARWRQSRGVERHQLQLFAYMVLLIGVALALSVSGLPGPWGELGDLAVLGLPLAIAVAIFRYRLYDIDVLINRTLVYGVTTSVIAAAFFGVVVVLQSLLRPFTTGSELAVAASTLLTVALFQPLRRRVQDAVDRRFYRSRYDAAGALDAFGARLRDEVALDAVRADLLDVVHQTVRPAHAGVWLRRNDSRTPPA